VLDAIEASPCEEMWCLGDLVGYGADPDACVELARRHAASDPTVGAAIPAPPGPTFPHNLRRLRRA